MTVPLNASVASMTIAGRDYPRESVQNCKVCCSPHRLQAEQLLLEGVPPGAVVQRLPGHTDIKARNVADHLRNAHLPITDPAVIAYQERLAARDGATAESAVEAVADYLELARLVVGQVSQRVTDGDAIPSVRDGLAAARLLTDVDRSANFDAEEMMLGFLEYVDATKAETDPEQFQRIMQRLQASPVLRWLIDNARSRGRFDHS